MDLTQSNEKTIQKVPELKYTIFGETSVPCCTSVSKDQRPIFPSKRERRRRGGPQPELTAVLSWNAVSLTPRIGPAQRSMTGRDDHGAAERKYTYAGADLNARISRVYGKDEDEA